MAVKDNDALPNIYIASNPRDAKPPGTRSGGFQLEMFKNYFV
jgi:hypothetical protein